MDGGAWWATVQGLGEKCQTQLKRLGMHTHTHTHTHTYFFSVGDLPFTFLMVSFDEQKF